MNAADFRDAIDFAVAHEMPWPRDPQADPSAWGVHHEDPPPYNALRGPVHGVARCRAWSGGKGAKSPPGANPTDRS